METDPRLLEQAVSGDRRALERLLLECHRPLCARLERKIPAAQIGAVAVEDVLQETFAEAFRKITKFELRGGHSFYSWLCLISDHRLADMVKAGRAAKRGGDRHAVNAPVEAELSTVTDLLGLLAVNEHTPSRSVARREAVDAVRVALEQLPDDYREALQLRYLSGLAVADIARQMNRTEGAIHMLCNRGLKQLHAVLGQSSQYFTRRG